MSKSIVVGVSSVFCRNNNRNKIDTEEESSMFLNFSVTVRIPVTSSPMEAPAVHR